MRTKCLILFSLAIVFSLTGCAEDSEIGAVPITESLSESKSKQAKEEEGVERRPVPSKSGPWPVCHVEESVYDFGLMQVNAQPTHVFKIENRGDAPLKMTTGKTTCKCTLFELSRSEIGPGETAELKMRWKPIRTETGFRHGGPLYTNDPNSTEVQFAVTGDVENAVELLPSGDWSVGEVRDGVPGAMRATLSSKVHKDFRITDLKIDSPHVTAEIVPLDKDRLLELRALGGYAINVSLSPDIVAGPFEAEAELHVDCLEEPIVAVVKGTRVGPIRVQAPPGVIWIESSRGLKLGSFPSSKGRTASLMFLVDERKLEGETFQIVESSATPGYIETSLESLGVVDETTSRYRLDITIPPGTPKGQKTGANPAILKLKTNHPADPEMLIRLGYRIF